MPEDNTVRGMDNPSVAGPPTDQPSHTVSIPPWDLLNHGVIVGGNPANKPKVVIETGPGFDDVTLIDDDYEEDDD